MFGTPNRTQAWLNFAQRSRDEGGLGLAPHQAAGLVGNLVNESGGDLNPWGPTGDNGTAWGTAQWRGDRLARLKARPDYQTMEGQQAHMRDELLSSEGKAYAALQNAQSPEEAARIVDQLYERSDGSTRGKREASARALMDQFGGGGAPDQGGALAFAPTNTGKQMGPALSPDEMMGPGALNPGYGGDRIGDGLIGIGSSLAGISNPDQAKALTAQLVASQKQAVDRGTWSVQTMPNGQSFYFNNKTGQRIDIGNFAKPEENAFNKKYDEEQAKGLVDENANIAKGSVDAAKGLSTVNNLRSVFSNPDLYQGAGGEWVQTGRKLLSNFNPSMAKTVADGDVANALSREMALKLVNPTTGESKLLPGSMSDSDRNFVVSMATSLNNSQEANMRLLDIYERGHKRAQEADAARKQFTSENGGRLTNGWYDKKSELADKWAQEDRAREAQATQQQPQPKQNALPKGVQSIKRMN